MAFEPGQSGNPAGRPKADKAFANMLRIAIKQAHDEGRDKLRAVADALVDKAISGDVQAINAIADRLDGKVPQAVDANLSGNVVVNLVRFSDGD